MRAVHADIYTTMCNIPERTRAAPPRTRRASCVWGKSACWFLFCPANKPGSDDTRNSTLSFRLSPCHTTYTRLFAILAREVAAFAPFSAGIPCDSLDICVFDCAFENDTWCILFPSCPLVWIWEMWIQWPRLIFVYFRPVIHRPFGELIIANHKVTWSWCLCLLRMETFILLQTYSQKNPYPNACVTHKPKSIHLTHINTKHGHTY